MDILLRLVHFFIDLFFQFFLFILIVRFIVKFIKVDWTHPMVAMVYRFSDPVITPLQKFFKDFGAMEAATLLLIYCITLIKIMLNLLIASQLPGSSAVLLWALIDVASQFVNFYVFTLLALLLLTWLNNLRFATVLVLLGQITAPLLKPLRKVVPLVRGFDLSPLVAILILFVIQIVMIEPMLTHVMRSVLLGQL